MTKIYLKKTWYEKILETEFESSSGPTPQWVAFAKEVESWFSGFCKEKGYTDFSFSRGHFYFSGFFKVKEQWWYFLSGDVRSNIMPSLVVRKCSGPKDFQGERNNNIRYDTGNFKQELWDLVRDA